MSRYENNIINYLMGFLLLFLIVPILKGLAFILNFFPPEQQGIALIVIAIIFGILVGGLGRYVRNLF